MLHDIFYVLHLLGMATILLLSIYITLQKETSPEKQKKLSLYLMSAAHTQVVTGVILFFIKLSEVNHMKIGIKILLAIAIATFASVYKKKSFKAETVSKMFPLLILVFGIITTLIAFFIR